MIERRISVSLNSINPPIRGDNSSVRATHLNPKRRSKSREMVVRGLRGEVGGLLRMAPILTNVPPVMGRLTMMSDLRVRAEAARERQNPTRALCRNGSVVFSMCEVSFVLFVF